MSRLDSQALFRVNHHRPPVSPRLSSLAEGAAIEPSSPRGSISPRTSSADEDQRPSIGGDPDGNFDFETMQYRSSAFTQPAADDLPSLKPSVKFPSAFVSRVKRLSSSFFKNKFPSLQEPLSSPPSLRGQSVRSVTVPSIASSRSSMSSSASSLNRSQPSRTPTSSSIMSNDFTEDQGSFDPEKAFSSLLERTREDSEIIRPVSPKLKVVDALGRGGFSIVLKVTDVNSGDSYAMKKINKATYSSDPKMKHQLNLELQVMRELSASPFIQPTEHIFEDRNFLYIIFEELYGDLFSHLSTMQSIDNIQGGHLPRRKARTLLAEVCLALEHLHGHNFIHRDLKLENIAVDKLGHIKLIDFGLAMRCDSDVQHMRPVGSISIMPPELIQDHTGGKHTDWWAYGVLTFELLTGKSPWTAVDDVENTCIEICNVNFKPPARRSNSEDVSTEFICALLNKDFRKRLGTVSPSDPSKKNAVRNSPFFKSVNWEKFEQQRNKPAFIPRHGCSNLSRREKAEVLAEHRASINDVKAVDFRDTGSEEDCSPPPLNGRGRGQVITVSSEKSAAQMHLDYLRGHGRMTSDVEEGEVEEEGIAAGGGETRQQSKKKEEREISSENQGKWSLGYRDAKEFLV